MKQILLPHARAGPKAESGVPRIKLMTMAYLPADSPLFCIPPLSKGNLSLL